MKYCLGFIGCGNMGRAMLAGALNAGLTTPERISVHTHTDAHQQKSCDAEYGAQRSPATATSPQRARSSCSL